MLIVVVRHYIVDNLLKYQRREYPVFTYIIQLKE